jgi:transcriptional regulator with XRE-family HTH domain
MVLTHPLRDYRTKNSLTLAQLAEQLGVSLATVSRWETGQREPRGRELAKIVEVTGLSKDEILSPPTAPECEVAQ